MLDRDVGAGEGDAAAPSVIAAVGRRGVVDDAVAGHARPRTRVDVDAAAAAGVPGVGEVARDGVTDDLEVVRVVAHDAAAVCDDLEASRRGGRGDVAADHVVGDRDPARRDEDAAAAAVPVAAAAVGDLAGGVAVGDREPVEQRAGRDDLHTTPRLLTVDDALVGDRVADDVAGGGAVPPAEQMHAAIDERNLGPGARVGPGGDVDPVAVRGGDQRVGQGAGRFLRAGDAGTGRLHETVRRGHGGDAHGADQHQQTGTSQVSQHVDHRPPRILDGRPTGIGVRTFPNHANAARSDARRNPAAGLIVPSGTAIVAGRVRLQRAGVSQ